MEFLINSFSSAIFGTSLRIISYHTAYRETSEDLFGLTTKFFPVLLLEWLSFKHVSAFCLDLFFLHSLITRMLQRDPKRRASLEEIENHAWLQGVDPSPATKYNIPLVSYKNLSEEEHNSIIQRMVLGDIADRDTIVE